MTKKRVITQIAEVDKLLEKLFPDGWIDSLVWTDDEKSRNSYFEGKDKISDAENQLFVLFSKTIMQGDHLRFSTDGLDSLLDRCTFEVVETGSNKLKSSLQNDYQQLLTELRTAIMLTKFYFHITSEIYEIKDSRKSTLNFIEVNSPALKNGSWLALLNTIIDIWLFEYRFSYDQRKIRNLLISKEHIEKAKGKTTDSDVKKYLELAVFEIDILLLKLSHFAKNKRIEYQFNFKNIIVAPKGTDKPVNEVYSNYLKFINPEKYVSEEDVYQWQSHPNKQWAQLGQMVLLMRYYTKVTRNITQAENLLKEYELFYNEKMMYVIALGNILIIFVCLGYFAVRDKYDKTKCWLFGILMILSALSIYSICRDTPVEKNVNPKNKPQTQVKKDNNQFEG